jgi:epoxyqueuosine reductase
MLSPDALKSHLRARAHALGFDLFGVASADPAEEDLARLRTWIATGNAADMDYLRETMEERAAPLRLLEGARSVIAVGMSYAQEVLQASDGSQRPEGRVARFALGRDYHAVLGPRLEELATILSDEADAASRRFVDTGPLLERAFAARAGLGFIGKNCCLIHPTRGSWFVLGCLVTTAELPPDSPIEKQCGDCRKCLDACPAGAFADAYQLDCRRCLSYQTIETRGELAPEAMTRQGDRLFGCDACQEVCPFNRSPLPCRVLSLLGENHGIHGTHGNRPIPCVPCIPWSDDEGTPSASGEANTLERILRIRSNREFERLFRGSGLLRPGRKGLLRNACIAAGNLRRTDLAPLLEALAASEKESPVVRQTAAWALHRIGRDEERCRARPRL